MDNQTLGVRLRLTARLLERREGMGDRSEAPRLVDHVTSFRRKPAAGRLPESFCRRARSLRLDEALDVELSGDLFTRCMHLVQELRGHGLYAPSGEQPGENVPPRPGRLRQTGWA